MSTVQDHPALPAAKADPLAGTFRRPHVPPAVVAALCAALLGGAVGGGVVAALDGGPGTAATPLTLAPAVPLVTARGLDVHAILAKAQKSVVTVRSKAIGVDSLLQPVAEEGTGTGILLSADGLILTNDHVVDGASSLTVQLGDGRSLPATVVGAAPGSDLAVVRVAATGLPVAELGDSSAVQVGDPVVAIGNALALPGGPTVTDGIVSARDRSIATDKGARLEHLLQTDAAINPGNSGGPLLDSAGRVIGINTAVASSGQNIGFAIAITPSMALVHELEGGASVAQPYLGVQSATVTPPVQAQFGLSSSSSGALVVAVSPDSPAAGAGVRSGDVVIRLDGTPVVTSEDLAAAIGRHRTGETVGVVLVRGGSPQTVTVRLTARPTR